MRPSVLVLSPEPPYPLHGGGPFRVASLLNYFARFANIDFVLFSESGKAALMPDNLVRRQDVIPLPVHRTTTAARYVRNARRALQGVPPLVDRLGGQHRLLRKVLAGRHYDLGMVEHFWCAGYLDEIAAHCDQTVLDLHNIESVLHERCAQTGGGLAGAGHARFARCSRKLEAALVPRYSLALAASEEDAATMRRIAPGANIAVYPNTIPEVAVPVVPERELVVFSGNFEYHPNIDAVGFLVASIWPEVVSRCPGLRLRLVGRGERFIRHLLPSGMDIETTGPVEDALREIAAARIVIAPLRAGSGTRIKILEAWAAARSVIATSLAAEGLQYQRDRDVLIADGALEFALAIVGLNGDSGRRAQLAASGRRLFEARYTWQAGWRGLDEARLFSSTGTNGSYTGGSDANRR